MDQDTQEYYDNYFSLFSTAGWKQLMEEFSSNAFNINSVEATKDPDEQANGFIGVLRGCFHVDHTNVVIGQRACLDQLEIWGVAYEPEVHRFL